MTKPLNALLCALTAWALSACEPAEDPARLERWSLTSQLDGSERDYFVYLPEGYNAQPDKRWPTILFLHGNGERGNGKSELDYVLTHGPLYEAWVQKRNLPFVIIAPQLPMFDFASTNNYFNERTFDQIPRRQYDGTPEREKPQRLTQPMISYPATDSMSEIDPLLPKGWETIEKDLLEMLSETRRKLRVDKNKTYLTGLSYGGFGSWYMASKYPETFAAVAPVAGWGHPSLMTSISQAQVPVWCFAGGMDPVIPIQHFYPGLNLLRDNSSADIRFTIHADMAHDVWRRVYAGEDIYHWFLQHSTDTHPTDQ
ncbi:alpha/beta hydrolase-fold protein [Simiduia agarivorans]|uniref:Peptidase-like protein n=1 Tax=Simiduia agarivorans (strain DSM 21679 / JCM 13881 / BCRC 17597 / SA1) TaxID=1117647 RepID=K4KQA6_SIMAS|nr:alpha/beta hydrolase-fold protein [Simiduia agarivorans]AFV00456.1 peptidase-like protein [Simiduia agarivorans SA1 = DSM 21679]